MLSKSNVVHPTPIEEESESFGETPKTPTSASAVTEFAASTLTPVVAVDYSEPIQVPAEPVPAPATDSEAPITPVPPLPEEEPDLSDEEAEPEPQGVRLAPEGKEKDGELGPDINAYIGPLEIPGHIDDELLGSPSRSRADSATSRASLKPQPTIEALRHVGHLVIKQINKDKEDFANVPNNYDIVAKGVGRIFIGKEETHPEIRAKVRTSTAISQPFRMCVYDVSAGLEVIRIDRNGVNEAPTMVVQKLAKNIDEQLGVIHFDGGWLLMTPTYTVQDHTGKTVLRITGPPSGRLCNSIKYVTSTFDIFEPDGTGKRVAKITKDGDFYVSAKDRAEPITKEENLYIDFEDETMDVEVKALILGTTFMLDYTYYKEPSFLSKLAGFCCFVLPCCRSRK